MSMAWCDTAKVVKIGPLDARALLPWVAAVIPFALWKVAIAAVITVFFVLASVIKGMEVDMFLRWIRGRFAGVFRPALPSWLTHRSGRSLYQAGAIAALTAMLVLAPVDPAQADFEIIAPAPATSAGVSGGGTPSATRMPGPAPFASPRAGGAGASGAPVGISAALRMRLPNHPVKGGSKGEVPAAVALRYLVPKGWSVALTGDSLGETPVSWSAGGQWIDALYRIALVNDWVLGIDPEGRRVIVQPAKMRDRDLCRALGDLVNPEWEMRFHSARGKYGLCDPVQGGAVAGAQ